jgi:hypothetical protein
MSRHHPILEQMGRDVVATLALLTLTYIGTAIVMVLR